jgi:N-formylglutamate deformylase
VSGALGVDAATLRLPDEGAPVLLYDSPHSGRFYPPDFDTAATGTALRRGEDAYVDELIGPATTLGVAVLSANYPRCYIDVNRSADDLDAGLLAEPWPGPLQPTEKSRRGLGLIRRFVTPGVLVHARPLTVAEVRRRIELVYEPYHHLLGEALAAIRRARGFAWHVDWHSMKSVGNAMTPDGEGTRRPDFVIGDLEGRSAEPALTDTLVRGLRDRGYTVALNDPYRGGTIVQRYGRPAEGVHVVQVEMNRALYLDEGTVTTHDGYLPLQRHLLTLTRDLVAAAQGRRSR